MTDRVMISALSCPCLTAGFRANGFFAAALAAPLLFVGSSQAARAQATLRITVRNAKTQAFVSRALIRLDSQTERAKQKNSDIAGLAVFPVLDAGTYAIAVSAVNFRTATRDNILVGESGIVNVEIALTPSDTIEINKNGTRELLNRGDTSISTRRDASFFQDYPVGVGNRQSLSKELRAVPGVAGDSVNQFHIRGDNTLSTATYIDGFLLPAYAQGAISQFLLPDVISSTRVITGNYAPEFGGGGGGILDLTLRTPSTTKTGDATVKVGNYGTSETFVNLDNPFRLGGKRPKAAIARSNPTGPLNYTLALSQRYTDNALETPQEGNETTRNYGASEIFFGKFDYRLSPRATVSLLLNLSSGRSDLAPRSGDTGFGLGYGYGGFFGADSGLATQKDAGYSFVQKDNNNLFLLQFKTLPRRGGSTVISVATSRSNLFSYDSGSPLASLSNLPANSSLDFSSSNYQDYSIGETQVDFTLPRGTSGHAIKFGLAYHDIDGKEAYYYRPQSQFALDALYALEPRLVPQGGTATGATDSLGNPVYQVGANPASPVLYANRRGYYAGVYAQDTWRIRPNLTVNYGARIENYFQTAVAVAYNPASGAPFSGSNLPDIDETEITPRFNAAFTLTQSQKGRGLLGFFKNLFRQPTIVRAGYNRLFTPPGLSQGTFIGNQPNNDPAGTTVGNPVLPQITDQYDLSLERQFRSNILFKVGYYNKDIKDYLTNQTLLQGLQNGPLAVFNQGDYTANGVEVSVDLLPSESNLGPRAYLAYANSTIKPKDFRVNNLNQIYQGDYAEADQRSTLSAGIAYNFVGGASVGLTGYYGSGLYSSAFQAYSVSGTANRSGGRDAYSEVNLRLASGPRFFKKHAGVELQVENLFDGNSRQNYEGTFAGTRYQQGRRIFAVLTGKF